MGSMQKLTVLLAVAAICQGGPVRVVLTPGMEYMIESTNYPEQIEANNKQAWMLTSPQGTQIQIKCIDVRLIQDNRPGCDVDVLTIDDGQQRHELCGDRYDDIFVSARNTYSVALKVGPYPSGGVSCRATLFEEERATEASQRWPERTTEAVHVTPVERSLHLVPGGDKEFLTTPKYPEHAGPHSKDIWHLETDAGSKIRISCTDIRIYEGSQPGTCEEDEYVEVSDGAYTKQLCGNHYDYTYLTTGNTLTVKILKGKHGGGGVKCAVQGRVMDWYGEATTPHYLNIDSEEVDSSEHGGPPGSKTTNCPCGWANKPNRRIVAGEETAVNEFPFMAALLYNPGGSLLCGGPIITQYHILTAAHCTRLKTPQDMVVVVGEHDLTKRDESTATEKFFVERIIDHPQYDPPTLKNDISILVLQKKITFSKLVGPVCIPKSIPDLTKQYVKEIGWGKVVHGGRSSPVLKKVDVRVVHIGTCHNVFSSVSEKNVTQLCTFSNAKGSCQGDSGGPVVWVDPETNRYTVVGLVSFGSKCAGDLPSVNTNVASFYNWIQDTVAGTYPEENTCSKID